MSCYDKDKNRDLIKLIKILINTKWIIIIL